MKKVFFACLLLGCVALGFSPLKQRSVVNDGKIWSLLYQQQAAEYRALCFQAYNIAQLRLDEALKKHHGKPLAVVTDIDETVLDNSPYDAARAKQDSDFTTKTWKQWTAKGIADTVPGAPSFFKYAASRGVAVFYVTNRDEDEMTGTVKNLELYNMPYADNAHILLRNGTGSKEARRQLISKKYNIVLLCGDNLPDEDKAYDGTPTLQERMAATEKLRKEFGNRYIVLPNPAYNDWESALYKFNFHLNHQQKDSIITAMLKADK